MSSIINKAKDKIEATLSKNDNPKSDNYGPNSSNIGNKIDPQVDSDLDGRHNPHSHVGGHGHAHAHQSTTLGSSGIGPTGTHGSTTNDPAFNNPQSTNAGPHSSNLMNKLDPRTDSDRDNRNDPTSRVGGYGTQGEHHGQPTGIGGIGGHGTNQPEYGGTTHGLPPPTGGLGHDTVGHTGHTSHAGHTGHAAPVGGLAAATTTGTTGSGITGTSGAYDNPQSTNAGPHSSNLMNKLDPRHDSDRDNRNDPTSRVGGYGTQGENLGHSTGIGGPGAGVTGGYGSGMAHGTTGGYDQSSHTPGSGTATGTAGPHNSNIMNKLDPRVDSDMDGSKTYGGTATHR